MEHQQRVLDKLTEAKDSLACAKYEKAKEAIEEGIGLSEKRIKVIKFADRSEFGWSTVKEYLSDELASNSEDEKRIFRSERHAERRSKQASSRRRIKASGLAKEVKSTCFFEPWSSIRFPGQSGTLQSSVPRNRTDPCYKLSIRYFVLSLSLLCCFAYSLSAGFPRHIHYAPLGCLFCLFFSLFLFM